MKVQQGIWYINTQKTATGNIQKHLQDSNKKF